MKADVFRHFPGWVWSVDVQPSTIEGLVHVKVAVTRIPGMPTGADLSLSSPSETTEVTFTSGLSDRPAFELTRWLRHDAGATRISICSDARKFPYSGAGGVAATGPSRRDSP